MLIYSHRGYKDKENTMNAFINALNTFDGIEFDVRLTKDYIPVVIHDYNLLRTHNSNKIIHLTEYKDLKKYKLPLLIDVLKLVKDKKKRCLIDIKSKKDTQFIINYLKILIDNKIVDNSIFKCLVYTDNIKYIYNISILRAYKSIIPKNNIKNFDGIGIKLTGSVININSILSFIKLNSIDIMSNKLHINIYIINNNKKLKKYIESFLNKYKKYISLTI